MNYYLYKVTRANTGVTSIKISDDIKEVYKDVMKSKSFKIKKIDINLKTSIVTKKDFYQELKSIDQLQAYRFTEHISTSESLLYKNRSDFNISYKSWEAYKSIERTMI